MADKKFLSGVYGLDSPQATQSLYDDWAATYETEIEENGYATPGRCAAALAAAAEDISAPVLDLGCGTGLGGAALRAAGFTMVDGSDLSKQMLAEAAKRAGVYCDLIHTEIADPLPFAPGAYANVMAAGVISPQHAPAETIDAVLEMLPTGGCLAFSLNDNAIEDPAFPGKVHQVTASSAADLVFEEHGPHLPGIGLEATVYVLRKR